MNKTLKSLLAELMQTVGQIVIEDEKEQSKQVVRYEERNGVYYIKEFTTVKALNQGVEPCNRRLTTEYQEKEEKPLQSKLSVEFTKKEINSMPTKIKKTLLLNGLIVNCRLRKDKACSSYELRYRKDGYNISVSGRTQEIAKARFLEKAKSLVTSQNQYPTLFNDFALFYIENYKKKVVAIKQYKNALMRLKNDISPAMKNLSLLQVTPLHCQILLEKTIKQGYGRKAEDIKCLLNQVFNYAKKLDLLKVNPIDLVVIKKHERQHGRALTKQEEKCLFEQTKSSPLQIMFAVALYCGLRPVEYQTAKIDGAFIVCENAKRKNGKKEFKKIPISPMLAPYLVGVKELKFHSYTTMRFFARKYLFGESLYCLRTTFFNRCIECGVKQDVRDLWLGHKTNNVRQAYTDISDELHLEEVKKFKYDL